MGSVGQPLKRVQVKVIDPQPAEGMRYPVGEIAISGDIIMQGYYNRANATAETIREGWLYSGDLATRTSAAIALISQIDHKARNKKLRAARMMSHAWSTLLQSGKEPGCRLGRANPPGLRKEINDVFTLEVVEDCPVCLCAYRDGRRGIGCSIV
jgi:hypothetical protein